MCSHGALLCALLLLCAAGTAETKKGRKSKQRQAQLAKQKFGHLDPSWASHPAATGNRARLTSRYTLGASEPDRLPMTVEPELMHRWEEARVPSKPPEVARGTADPLNMQSARNQGNRKQALNQRDWLRT